MPRKSAASRAGESVTLQDVAKLAGVSPMTVSRVVNRPELVTQDTLARVRQVIDRTGYVPNLLAGGLASRKSRLVAALVPSITNGIFVEAVQALTDRLWESGYQVLLGLSGYPATREDALLSAVLARKPDAIYLTGINHSAESRQRLLAAHVPIVETWDLTPTPLDTVVGFSHERVGEAVARHLLAHGALEEARSRALRVPEDVAIVGFGGLEFTEHTYPALSTVSIDRSAIGRSAAEIILVRIDGGELPERVIDVGFTIVDRGTT